MNIKEHIEAGHYPRDEKGRALVPTDLGGCAVIAATDAPGVATMIGWWDDEAGTETQMVWREDGAWWRSWSAENKNRPHLLPPPPRKVPMKAWVLFNSKGQPFNVFDKPHDPSPGMFFVEMTGEREEPWS